MFLLLSFDSRNWHSWENDVENKCCCCMMRYYDWFYISTYAKDKAWKSFQVFKLLSIIIVSCGRVFKEKMKVSQPCKCFEMLSFCLLNFLPLVDCPLMEHSRKGCPIFCICACGCILFTDAVQDLLLVFYTVCLCYNKHFIIW